MYELSSHKTGLANEALEITVRDQPGSGGAHHLYLIAGFEASENRSNPGEPMMQRHATSVPILFQNGPIGENGVNGITNEALLAIVEDRLAKFQAGPFACSENGKALLHVKDALYWLRARTIDRLERGVEGSHEP